MKTSKRIKRIRVILSVTILILITLLFLNISGDYRRAFSWLAKIQFLPAAFSFSIGVFISWLIITLQVGRVYCSSTCPLGTLQDFFAWLNHRKKKGKPGHNYHYTTPFNGIRYTMLTVFGICVLLGVLALPMLIDPYSAYGRMVNTFLLPIRNAIVDKSFVSLGNYTLLGCSIGVITFITVAWISFKKGRLICNTICPVGSTLGLISRYSVWQMEIDTDKCIGCLKCQSVCKSSCIDIKSHLIDTSRCVMCLNCVGACNFDALHFTASRKRLSKPLMQPINEMPEAQSVNMDRRKFMLVAGAATTCTIAAKAIDKITDSEARLKGSQPINRKYSVTPPGTLSRDDFHHHCTACMLCVNNCPQKVLKPSIAEYGISNLLQPTMAFDKSSCKKGCTRCTRLCPTGALHPLTKEEKLNSPIGIAQVIPQNCISCGTCAKKCPYGAITMIISPTGKYIPSVNTAKCIGCGTCQLNCPARPIKAIWVEGIQ